MRHSIPDADKSHGFERTRSNMSFDLNASFNFFPIPTDLHFGHGVLAKLPEQVKISGGQKALLVTDSGVRRTGLIERAEGFLSAAGLAVSVYDGVTADS